MTVIEDEEQQEQQPTPTIETLEQKIDELANTIDELNALHHTYKSRKRAIMKLIIEVRQLASDLNVDDIRFREMISRSFAMTGVSESWLRKLLPESLKFTKHTRKDYLKRKQQRDQQPLIQPQSQLQELVELPASRQPVLEQQQLQQSSDGKATEVTTLDNKLAGVPQQTQKQEEEQLKLKQRIEELERENRYLREITGTQEQQQQLQQQHEETFAALGQLQLGDFRMRIKVTVNVSTKSIELMELAW
jgi:hypothetical protein